MNKGDMLAASRIWQRGVDVKGCEFTVIGIKKVKSSYVSNTGRARYVYLINYDSSYEVWVEWGNIVSGSIKDLLSPSLCGVGVLGYTSVSTGSREYRVWSSMISRCYNKGYNGYEVYGGRGVVVCDKWKRFDLFLEDLPNLANYDTWVNDRSYTLDKDFLVRDNIVYGPDSCSFQSKSIQATFQKKLSGKNAGSTGIRGITWAKNKKTYRVRISVEGKRMEVGGRVNLNDAVELLLSSLKKHKPNHPYVLYGLERNGIVINT